MESGASRKRLNGKWEMGKKSLTSASFTIACRMIEKENLILGKRSFVKGIFLKWDPLFL